MQLSDASVGTEVLVMAVEPGDAGQGRRLEDLGFVVGTRVRVERRAPLGDPTVYELRGTRIALRSEGAALVMVDALSAQEGVGG
ncbi:MAG TPA: FeoA family protein [Mycobacterium sp.]|nr:FeoA family protein [Mycobacterium sp.]